MPPPLHSVAENDRPLGRDETVVRSTYLLPHEISRTLNVTPARVRSWISDGTLGSRATPERGPEVAALVLVHWMLRRGLEVPPGFRCRVRLLIIDDEPEMLRSTARLLKHRAPHLDVSLAEGAATGLTIAAETRPDVVLVDMYMPHLTGVQVCGRIKEVPETANVSVIAFSGSRDDVLERDLRSAGAAAILDKPPDVGELFSVLESELSGPPASAPAREGLGPFPRRGGRR